MSAGKQTKQAVQRMVANEVKFAVQTARALTQSARQVKQPRRQKRQTDSLKGSGGSATMVTAPRAEAAIMHSFVRGLPDMRNLVMRYDAGNLCIGNGTIGQTGSMAMQPTSASTQWATRWIPILPADTASINGSSLGWGVSYVQDVVKHFARIRYNRIRVHCLPWGVGSDTGAQASFVITPFRGAVVSPWATTNAGGAYEAILATGTTFPSISLNQAQGCRGSYSGPCWKPFSLDLTPYIAGGSGPRQNEFIVNNVNLALGSAASIPACFALQGVYGRSDASTLANNTPTMQIVVEIDVDLLDFNAVTPSGGIVPVGAHQDVKDQKTSLPAPLTFRDVVRRRVEDAPSPTQSLLGAELHTTHVVPAAARATSAAMPIPERKPRGT